MDIDKIIKVLKNKKQIVLQGAPGTGKTYITAELAVRICDGDAPKEREDLMKRYRELMEEGRIAFTTFHQSMDYEQFVEGFVPQIIESTGKGGDSKMVYRLRDGIFKQICNNALRHEIDQSKVEDAYKKLIVKIDNGETELNVERPVNNGIIKFLKKDKVTPSDCTSSLDTIKKIMGMMYPDKRSFEDAGCKVVRKYQGQTVCSGSEANHALIMKEMFEICDDYKSTTHRVPYVLIIDEINRGNISKILGELITLLEADKRAGEDNCVSATLPYSNENFSVPSNLYIIGTMNTADRSVGYIDYAVRRRFAFMTIKADRKVVEDYYKDNEDLRKTALSVFDDVENHITGHISPEMKADDVMVGHSYFLAKDEDEFNYKLEYEIKPLLSEYFADGIITKEYEE